MHIAIDIRCLMDKDRSGVGEYTFQLLDRWFREEAKQRATPSTRDDQSVDFFLFYNSWHDVRANLPQWNYPFVHYSGFRWPNKLLNFCLRFLHWPKLDRLITKHDSIDYFLFPNQNFYALSRGVKKIVIVHDLSFEVYPECFSIKQRLWHKVVNLQGMARDAEKIIAVSENTKLDLVNLYKVDSAKIEVIYPTLQKMRDRAFSVGSFGEDGDEHKKDYILFLGTIEPRKNVLGLLKAYNILFEQGRELPDLWIAGKTGYRSGEVFNYWKNMKARDRVTFLGYVSEDQKWELYRSAKFFIYPSLYEGFGMPILEAMSAGLPVIASLISSMPEIVGNAGILIDPMRINDLARAIRLLIENETLRQGLGERAIARAAELQDVAKNFSHIFTFS